MGFFSDDSPQALGYRQSTEDTDSVINWNETLTGGAAWEAAKAYKQHVENYGNSESEEQAKELLAAFVDGFVEKRVDILGLKDIDREKIKHDALQQVIAAGKEFGYF